MTLASVVRSALERTLVYARVPALGRRLNASRTLILAYHNVVPDDATPAGDSSLHLPQSVFAAQLDALVRTHDVVGLDGFLDQVPSGGRRPRAVLTFDDAYRGAITLGVPELVRRRLPATFFVTPAFVGGGSFWWDVLAEPSLGGPSPRTREHALGELKGVDSAIRRWAAVSGLKESRVAEYAVVADETELRAAARHEGIVFGSHTWSHPNLARLDEPALAEELARPLGWLRERFARVSPWLSYPYGLYDQAVERAAEHAGYRGGLGMEGTWVPRRPQRLFGIPRLNIPASLTDRGFVLRASGAVPW